MTKKIIGNVEFKKKYFMSAILGTCLIFGSIMGCASSSDEVTETVEQDETVKEGAPEMEEETSESETVVEVPQKEDYRIFVGDSFTVYYDIEGTATPALEVTVTDVGNGVFTESLMNENVPYVYAELDIKNIFDQESNITGSCFQGFYGDDYKLESDIIPYMKDTLVGKSVIPGRKIKGRYYAACEPSIDQYNVIELAFGGQTIVIKDPSLVPESNSSSTPDNHGICKVIYGTFVFDDTEWGNIGTAEVGFNTGDGVDTIHIEYRGEDGNTIIEFNGILEPQKEDGTYTAYCTDYDAEINCTFYENSLGIEVADIEFNDGWDIAGSYKLESKLNLDEVG